ncbi:MAG: hypothetical protein ACFFG0_17850, partial [Candidatus Thorarchaeota archaeon]
VYNTESWIDEVHTYNGICPSCMEKAQQENKMQQETAGDTLVTEYDTEHAEKIKDIDEKTQISPIEIEKILLSSLEHSANDILTSGGSIDVLIKEIKDGLIDKAKVRIEETFQSFDVNKIDTQKVVDYVEKTFDYLSEYKDFMDDVVNKIQVKSKIKVKAAIEKVFKETMVIMPKDIAKDVFLNKKAILKTVFEKAEKWYSIYSDTDDKLELTTKMIIHPIKEIQKKLSTLPFYALS